MKSYFVFFSLIVLFLAGCSKSEKDQFEEANRLVQEKKYTEAISALEKVAKEFPTGDFAAKAYYEVAKLYQAGVVTGLNETASQEKAVEYYQKVFVNYPKFESAPSALFMSGFIQANILGKYNEATVTYKKFLQTYPNSELADDAKVELDNMGLSPEEIVAKHQTQFTIKK
ncbi:MAG: tetratricopeptide repeat protein [Ignavibacteriaceae bacterium]|jgi:TolA-binding protein|nr:tetratricopeptide repeat protein [Ignavibacteriaceae bacterium]